MLEAVTIAEIERVKVLEAVMRDLHRANTKLKETGAFAKI